ncbi:hypothetical protein M409DRAFT_17028 [Zasmidium cellare ATCC 36951]|uniref:Uncharacterized protein n=1 Tax=Zasmidium cellare ATCC 36951 TaxID=1080233 RepID=A0A6A6D3W0_ZASCE|nr:uncharacterized protein M409DRAFT_17028 [Zasmidium cellare ATCC 36951]KAF2173080.1 hypothetical protein M409DRAFT_17028 [Zasmidium cellare ATCC 36951]
MAAADPLPAKSVPVKDTTTCGNDTVKATKQKQRPLDTALLCNRLEEHQREQEAARLRREKRNAVRNGSYVPRSAAKSFAATATPMRDVTNLPKGPGAKRRSAPPNFIAEPLTVDGRICIPARQRYAALNFGIGNSDVVGMSEDEEVSPIKPYRLEGTRDPKRDLKKLEERCPYKPAKKGVVELKNSAAAPRKASLPLQAERRPAINERRSSIQPTQLQRSKSTSTAPAPPPVAQEEPKMPEHAETSKPERITDQLPELGLPREVSPLRTEELELARGDERWPSINQDETSAIQASVQSAEEPVEPSEHVDSDQRAISLIQALNMDWNQSDEAEHSETATSFKWDQYDPFKPQTRGSAKSEKHNLTRLGSKRDSMNPAQNGSQNGDTSGTQSTPHRRRSSPRTSPQKHTSPSHVVEERGRQRYRPGDAAKRRTMADPLPPPVHWPLEQTPVKKDLRPISFHAITESRLSRFLEEEASLDAPIPEVDESLLANPRPKLVPHDRPNWTQQSQDGDDFRHTLNSFFPRPGRKAAQTNRHSSILAPFAEPKAPSPKKYTGPQNDHMIADAVKIIQQQEKVKRRESVIGFFKKL